MGAVRALQRRVIRLERAAKARPSPIAIMHGSFDAWVEKVIEEVAQGKLDCADMMVIVGVLRVWESDGTWHRAHAA